VIFAHQNLISNWLTYAKSTGELISFGFSDRSSEVWSQVNAQLIAVTKRKKNDFTFWLIFGLSPNLGLGETLSERLIQKVK